MKAVVIPGKTLIQPYQTTLRQLPTDKPIIQFIRQSTRKQQKHNKVSAEMQDSDMHRQIVAEGWTDELILPPIDEDSGKSGTKRRDQRSGLDRLYKLIEAKAVGTVAAFNVSRIYRVLSKAELGTFCDLVLENKVPILTKRRIYWPTPDDNKTLMADFQAAADYIEDHIKGVVIAAKNYNIETEVSYGGHNVPMGFIVAGMTEEGYGRKFYVIYEPHAKLIRWLFRRFHELNYNLPLLAQELERIDFRFPPFPDDIPNHVGLPQAADGSYPLRTRESIISTLTNKSYIGYYEYGGVQVSTTAHEPIVDMDLFTFAYEALTGMSIDGTSLREKKPRERRYGADSSLLSGIAHCGELPVYPLKGTYSARKEVNRFGTTVLAIDIDLIDNAFLEVFRLLLNMLKKSEDRETVTAILTAKVVEQVKSADEYKKSIARIDLEIKNALMAQSVSQELGDETGYRKATKELVGLQRDRTEIAAKLQHSDSEVEELKETIQLCFSLSENRGNLKRLAKILIKDANIIEQSPHFIQLDVTFGVPINKSVSIYIYRAIGSRVFWNDDKKAYLRAAYANTSAEDITAELKDHSWNSIRVMATELGLSRTLPGMNYDALTYSDRLFMAATGAKVHEVNHKVERTIEPVKS